MPVIELPSVAGTAGLIGTGHKEDELGEKERNAMFRSMARTDDRASKRGVNKLILGFAALVATAMIGTTGVVGATPGNGNGNNGQHGNHSNSHNQTGNLNQGLQQSIDGYGGGNVNIGVNIGLNNSNNNTIIIILRPIINIIR